MRSRIQNTIFALALAGLGGVAEANLLGNPGFETNQSGPYGPPSVWLAQGGWAPHAWHSKPGYVQTMGLNFGYYTPRDLNGYSVMQQVLRDETTWTDTYFEPGARYEFSIWANGGTSDGEPDPAKRSGTAILQIGFKVAGAFINLATKLGQAEDSWKKMPTLRWFAPTDRLLDEVVTVQLGPARDNPDGDNTDVWVDEANLEATPSPGTGLIKGSVLLQDFGPHLDPNTQDAYLKEIVQPISFEIIDSNGVVRDSFCVTLSNQRKFQAFTSLRGVYSIRAKASHWLAQTVSNVAITDLGVTGLDFSLINGDIDGDNAVTVFDYNLLSEAFDSALGDDNWNARADLDADDAVTVFDYNILSANFDLIGD